MEPHPLKSQSYPASIQCGAIIRSIVAHLAYLVYRVELVKRLPIHQYSVDIFSYSGLSGILGSDGKQNNT